MGSCSGFEGLGLRARLDVPTGGFWWSSQCCWSGACQSGGEFLGRGAPAEVLSRSGAEAVLDPRQGRGVIDVEVGALGRYWRSSPFMFSLLPRSQGLDG